MRRFVFISFIYNLPARVHQYTYIQQNAETAGQQGSILNVWPKISTNNNISYTRANFLAQCMHFSEALVVFCKFLQHLFYYVLNLRIALDLRVLSTLLRYSRLPRHYCDVPFVPMTHAIRVCCVVYTVSQKRR